MYLLDSFDMAEGHANGKCKDCLICNVIPELKLLRTKTSEGGLGKLPN